MLKEHWEKGQMAKAVEEIPRYIFEALNFNRVKTTTDSMMCPGTRPRENGIK